LNVIINCEEKVHHDWMAFASWYSIVKNLPDAQVQIYCKRTGNSLRQLFGWTYRYKVPLIKYHSINLPENSFQISPEIMAVSIYNKDALGPITTKSNENSTFVSYLEGCGKFVLSEWINSIRSPFEVVGKLYTDNLTVNELKVLKLWEKCYSTYAFLI